MTAKFNRGDTVRIHRPPFSGQRGIIVYVYGGGRFLTVQLIDELASRGWHRGDTVRVSGSDVTRNIGTITMATTPQPAA